MATGETLDFGGNLDHVTLGLRVKVRVGLSVDTTILHMGGYVTRHVFK